MKGLCSISFRLLSVDEIIKICKESGIEAIEWGGDVHVPPTDLKNAIEVGNKTRSAGLTTPSYGSYYRLDGGDFESVSETAKALGTSVIRVWAGNRDSEQTSEEEYSRLVSDLKRCADIAEKNDQTICFEYHYGTYCNGADSTLKLISDANRKNVKTYWQPMYWLNGKVDNEKAENLSSIKNLNEFIENIHVYNWVGRVRLPLANATDEWREYAELLGKERVYYLEFMPLDEVNALTAESKALADILTK